LNDLGVRNAILRDAPSLREADPRVLGPLIETMVHGVMRGTGIHVHFWREREDPSNRRSPEFEVDYVAEKVDGDLLPVEVQYRRTIRTENRRGLAEFMRRHRSRSGVVVTRESHAWHPRERILEIPLLDFLLAF
jgi:predicted AAA+ superfamily ATPase